MYTKREIQKIKNALPINGYQLIAEKAGMSLGAVEKVFSSPERYQKKVYDAAAEVIEAYQIEINQQKTKLLSLVK
jgi:hypothetical protein